MRRCSIPILALALGCSQAPAPDDDDSASSTPASCDEVALDPGATAAGYTLDGWAWQRHGLLREAPVGADLDGLLSPALVEVGGTIHLYYSHKQGLDSTLWRSSTEDWESWSAPQPVTGFDGDASANSASLLHDGQRYRMWIASGSLDVATSTDGLSWTVEQPLALNASGEGFDAWSLLYPSVQPQGGGYSLWYTGFDGASYAIGRATSPDGLTWERAPTGPLVQAGAGFDNRAVAQPSVRPWGEGWVMAYGGYDTSQTDPGPWRVGLARSEDGVTWERIGLALPLTDAGGEAFSTRDPALLHSQGRWHLVYVGLGEDLQHRLFHATSAVCP